MDLSGKTIIVTGGAGFIGSNLVERLVKNNNNVIVLDNFHTGSMDNLREVMKTGQVKVVRADAGEIDQIKEKPDLIYHIGTYSSTPMYKENHKLVGMVVNDAIGVYNYAVKNGNVPVVFGSSSSMYSGLKPPHNESMQIGVTDFYTEAKVAGERLGQMYNMHYGLDVTALRPFAVYGKHEESKKNYANMVTQFVWCVKKGEQPVIYGDGSQTRDFTYIDDVVDAFIKAADKKGFNAYNVGTGKNYTFNQVIEKLVQQTGKEIKPKYVPTPMKNYVYETLADPTKSEKELGFKARYSLDEGIKQLLDYY